MPRILLLLLLILASHPARSQNLVLNPSFESLQNARTQVAPCTFMKTGKAFNALAKNWASFPDRTPDLIRYDTTQGPCIYPPPRSGQHYVGLITFLPRQDCGHLEDYHEYIQGALSVPLVPGRRYKVSFWVSQRDEVSQSHLHSVYSANAEVYPVAANGLGIALQDHPLNVSATLPQQRQWLNMVPAFESQEILRTENGQWRQVVAWFTATTAARYFLLGNFRPDVDTKIDSRRDLSALPPLSAEARKTSLERRMRIAYYCIDDVSIEEAPYGDEMGEVLAAGGRYTFSGVRFGTGSHELDASSHEELGALAEWLRAHPEQRALIAGHTDNVGDDKANQQLSERRARAVHAYLLAQGVPAGQLSFKGYGAASPVAANATEAGRQQNRRVECVLR